MTWQGARRRHWLTIVCPSYINGNELQRRQVHASACIGRRSGFTLWVNSDTAKNLNQNQWLTPALSGQLPDLAPQGRLATHSIKEENQTLKKCSIKGLRHREDSSPPLDE